MSDTLEQIVGIIEEIPGYPNTPTPRDMKEALAFILDEARRAIEEAA